MSINLNQGEGALVMEPETHAEMFQLNALYAQLLECTPSIVMGVDPESQQLTLNLAVRSVIQRTGMT